MNIGDIDSVIRYHTKARELARHSIILKPKGVTCISDVEFRVSGHSLKSVYSVKLLVVKRSELLSVDDHVPARCNTASNQINALRRIV